MSQNSYGENELTKFTTVNRRVFNSYGHTENVNPELIFTDFWLNLLSYYLPYRNGARIDVNE